MAAHDILTAVIGSVAASLRDQGGAKKQTNQRTHQRVGCWIAVDGVRTVPPAADFASIPIRHASGARKWIIVDHGKVWIVIDMAGGPMENVCGIGPQCARIPNTQRSISNFTQADISDSSTSGPRLDTWREKPVWSSMARWSGAQEVHVAVPGGPPMHLTATGTERRASCSSFMTPRNPHQLWRKTGSQMACAADKTCMEF
jgi:hypothetical protein